MFFQLDTVLFFGVPRWISLDLHIASLQYIIPHIINSNNPFDTNEDNWPTVLGKSSNKHLDSFYTWWGANLGKDNSPTRTWG
jgi:hypothetical protein